MIMYRQNAMAKGIRKSKKSIPRRGRRTAKPRFPKSRGTDVPEMASLTVLRSANPVASGNLVTLYDINLAQFPRAALVSGGYQQFRIKSITVTVKPNMDSFTTVAAGSPQKPYIYYMVDRGGNIPTTITLEGLKQLGARPHQLDEKPFKMTYKPGVVYGVLDLGVGTQYNQYRVSPWLSCNANAPGLPAPVAASTVSHLGLMFFIEQVGALTTFNVDVTAEIQFIKPSMITLPSEVPPQQLTLADQDNSADGIANGR